MAFQASQTQMNHIKSLGVSRNRMSNTSSGGMYGVVVESLGLGLEFGAISICVQHSTYSQSQQKYLIS